MPTIKFLFLALLLLGGSAVAEPLALYNSKNFASRAVAEGELRLWRSGSSNYRLLKIDGERAKARFIFDGVGGSIGRISDIKESRPLANSNIRVNGLLTGLDQESGSYLLGVYGWALDRNNWAASKVRHEFYIIHSTNYKEKDPLIGRVQVGETVYRMHRHQFKNGSFRYKAIAEKPTPPSRLTSVNIAPFIHYWKSKGMGNAKFLHEVSWALELVTDCSHKGDVTLVWLK